MNLKQYLQEQHRLKDTKVNLEFDLDKNAEQTKKLTKSFNLKEGLTTYLEEKDYQLISKNKEQCVYSDGQRGFVKIKKIRPGLINEKFIFSEFQEKNQEEFNSAMEERYRVHRNGSLLYSFYGVGGMITATLSPLAIAAILLGSLPEDLIKNPYFLVPTVISTVAGFMGGGIYCATHKASKIFNKTREKSQKIWEKFNFYFGTDALEKLTEICGE